MITSESKKVSFMKMSLTEGAEPLPLSLLCCSAMFLQWPRMDRLNTGSRERLSVIFVEG